MRSFLKMVSAVLVLAMLRQNIRIKQLHNHNLQEHKSRQINYKWLFLEIISQ